MCINLNNYTKKLGILWQIRQVHALKKYNKNNNINNNNISRLD